MKFEGVNFGRQIPKEGAQQMIDTIEEAQQALQTAEMDVEADQGKQKVEEGWRDIVHAIATHCTDEVGAELIRRNL